MNASKIILGFFACIGLFCVVACGGDDAWVPPTAQPSADQGPSWLFIMFSPSASLTGPVQTDHDTQGMPAYELTLANLAPTVLAFTDIPHREVASLALSEFLAMWDSGNTFNTQPPNAVLEVHGGPAHADMTVVVIDSVVPDPPSAATFIVHEGSPENHTILSARNDHDPIEQLVLNSGPVTLFLDSATGPAIGSGCCLAFEFYDIPSASFKIQNNCNNRIEKADLLAQLISVPTGMIGGTCAANYTWYFDGSPVSGVTFSFADIGGKCTGQFSAKYPFYLDPGAQNHFGTIGGTPWVSDDINANIDISPNIDGQSICP